MRNRARNALRWAVRRSDAWWHVHVCPYVEGLSRQDYVVKYGQHEDDADDLNTNELRQALIKARDRGVQRRLRSADKLGLEGDGR
jgi:hypothetical protein